MGGLGGSLVFWLGGVTEPHAYARMMAALLPPGKLWRLDADSYLSKLLDGAADELGRLDERADDLLRESIPTDALELLPEYERELGLPSTGTDDERLARVVALTVTRQRFRPADFRVGLALLLGQSAVDVVVIERSRASAIAMADDPAIFRFFVYRNPALPGTYYLASAQAFIDAIKPSHTVGQVIESIAMICDDPFSLCDRDLLGA